MRSIGRKCLTPDILEAMIKPILIAIAALIAADLEGATLPDGRRQDLDQVRETVGGFLARETLGIPGKVRIDVGKIESRLTLHACPNLLTFFPAGSRAWGATSVGVRCTSPSAWTLYVPARVTVYGNYLIVVRPLRAGQEISAADISLREGELSQLPIGVLTDPAQTVGRIVTQGLQAGQPLRQEALREVPAILPGQQVALVVNGRGFRVSGEGKSLGKAAEGSIVQVRTPSGATVSGWLRPGSVVEVAR